MIKQKLKGTAKAKTKAQVRSPGKVVKTRSLPDGKVKTFYANGTSKVKYKDSDIRGRPVVSRKRFSPNVDEVTYADGGIGYQGIAGSSSETQSETLPDPNDKEMSDMEAALSPLRAKYTPEESSVNGDYVGEDLPLKAYNSAQSARLGGYDSQPDYVKSYAQGADDIEKRFSDLSEADREDNPQYNKMIDKLLKDHPQMIKKEGE